MLLELMPIIMLGQEKSNDRLALGQFIDAIERGQSGTEGLTVI